MIDFIVLDKEPFGFAPGAFLGVELRPDGELHAVAAFFYPVLKVGQYYPATGSNGHRYQVKVPECATGLSKNLWSILGDVEPGLESRYFHYDD